MLPCVVIPIYKQFENLTYYEIASLKQCFKILYNHDIWIVGPENHDFLKYIKLSERYKVDVKLMTFAPIYFNDINGYNKLLKSLFFYKKFSHYSFMLIYQPDSYVFRDELIVWCKKGYDYVGAPWFEEWGNNTSKGIIGVGNGGFALHNIQSAIKILAKVEWVHKFLRLVKRAMYLYSNKKYGALIETIILKKVLRIKNTADFMLLDINESSINEDYFWGMLIQKNFKKFKVSSVEDAIKFSFEVNPCLLYSLNGYKLPFGCHAWNKYNTEFWKPFIFGKDVR